MTQNYTQKLDQCQILFDTVLYTFHLVSHSSYTGPLCTIFAISCEHIIISKLKKKKHFHFSGNLPQVDADPSAWAKGSYGAKLNPAHSQELSPDQVLLDQLTHRSIRENK